MPYPPFPAPTRSISRKRLLRCPRCAIPVEACVCAELPSIVTRTRLVIVVHHDELHKPTSTGRLLANVLLRCDVVVRGARDGSRPSLALEGHASTRVLFPSDDAEPLTAGGEIDTLVIPEGTWGQAARVVRRLPELAGVRHVRLPEGPPPLLSLRERPRPDALPTAEAAIRALALLEGAGAAGDLALAYRLWHERMLLARSGRLG